MYPTEILNAIGGCFYDITMSHGLYASLFLAGLVGGFTHCIAMCGPFVLSQNSVNKLNGLSLLPYHLGRLTTYMFLAVLLSTVVNLAFLFLPVRSLIVAPILITAGVIFLVTAFPALGTIFPWTSRIGTILPYQWIASALNTISQYKTVWGRYIMGLLLGFMPCGLIVSALMAASTAPETMHAAIAMMFFGIGTMPALITVSLTGQAIKQKYPRAMQRISQTAMVWSSLWLFVIAGFLLI